MHLQGPRVSLGQGLRSSLALAQPLCNHAPRPSITREGPGQSELQKCYEPLDALTGSLAAREKFLPCGHNVCVCTSDQDCIALQVTQCTPKQNSSAHNPRQFCFSQKGSSCQNIPSFSLTFDSEINRYPERTTGSSKATARSSKHRLRRMRAD